MKRKTLMVVAAILLVSVATASLLTSDGSSKSSGHDCKAFSGKKYCAGDYIGLSQKDAIAKARSSGLRSRVVISDKNPNIVINDDHQDKRINFTIKNGKVAEAKFY